MVSLWQIMSIICCMIEHSLVLTFLGGVLNISFEWHVHETVNIGNKIRITVKPLIVNKKLN